MKKLLALLSTSVVIGFTSSCTSTKSEEPFAYHYLDTKTVVAEFHIKNSNGEIDTVYVPTPREKGKIYNCVDTSYGASGITYQKSKP